MRFLEHASGHAAAWDSLSFEPPLNAILLKASLYAVLPVKL